MLESGTGSVFSQVSIEFLHYEYKLTDQTIQASFHASNRDCSGCSVSFESYRATVTCVQIKLELCHPDLLEEEEEEEFYKLRPANKTDHLCQSWQYCHMFMKFRQSIT